MISMDGSEAVSLEQVRAFLAGSGEVRFAGVRRGEVYAWVERTLVRHEYAGLGRGDKGVVRQYVARMTGLSRAQVTRLSTAHRKTGRVKAAEYQRRKFSTRYPAADVELLAVPSQSPLSKPEGPGLRGSGAREPERAGHQADPPPAYQSIRQLPPALRGAGGDRRGQRQVPPYPFALGHAVRVVSGPPCKCSAPSVNC